MIYRCQIVRAGLDLIPLCIVKINLSSVWRLRLCQYGGFLLVVVIPEKPCGDMFIIAMWLEWFVFMRLPMHCDIRLLAALLNWIFRYGCPL